MTAATTPANTADVDKLVKIYVKMRDRKAELSAEEKSITAQQEIVEAELLRIAHETGVTGFKSAHGTTYVATDERYSMADDRTFIDFVKESGNIDLLERRVSSTNVKQYMKDHEGNIPPGLNFFKQERMKIRRASEK